MIAVNIDRLLVPAAVVLLLSGAPGGLRASFAEETKIDAPVVAPGNATAAADSAASPVNAPAIPEPSSQPAAAPADTGATAPSNAASTPDAIAGPDAAVAAQLHDLANGKFDAVLGNPQNRTVVDAFYSGRSY